jgi:beta-lactam-binding protein with PASTA domain
MSNLLSFLKTKQFFMHFGLALLSVFVIIFFLVKYLSSYTDHGEFVEVPDFTEKRITELGSFIQDKGVNYLIIDSIYDPAKTPGIVVKQEPFPKSKVKHNRNIYLYVTSMVPPQIEMPKLRDRSERQAKLIILSYGLKIGKVTTKSADCNGCVLEQIYKGKVAQPGEKIKKGSVIDLVVGVKDSFGPAVSDSLIQNVDKGSFDND